jgi:hypothetical protein
VNRVLSQALKSVGILVLSAPLSVVLVFLLVPFWRWLELRSGIEAIGHSGPAAWCYLAVYGMVVVSLVGVVWSRRNGRRRPADHAP